MPITVMVVDVVLVDEGVAVALGDEEVGVLADAGSSVNVLPTVRLFAVANVWPTTATSVPASAAVKERPEDSVTSCTPSVASVFGSSVPVTRIARRPPPPLP